MTKLTDDLNIRSRITEKELTDHIEEDTFFEQYPSPVLIETHDHKQCVLVSWEQIQRNTRRMELFPSITKPDYDPNKMTTITLAIDQDLYNKLDIICITNHMTVAGAIEKFIKWTVDHPEEVEKMVMEARENGTLDEYMNHPEVTIISEVQGDEEGQTLLKELMTETNI